MSNWTPTVDTYNDRRASHIPQDQAECRQLASQASGGTVKETFTGAGVGALIGAAGGAIAGAFIGNPATGAAIGAAAGGFGGGAGLGFNAENNYKQSYKVCMRHRGHTVI
jgi:uncharacterized membrane protein YebE (DUF533 family)